MTHIPTHTDNAPAEPAGASAFSPTTQLQQLDDADGSLTAISGDDDAEALVWRTPTTADDHGGVYTAYTCRSNADLIVNVAKLYAPPGAKIADMTYGKGVFWRRIDISSYDFHPSDVITVPAHPYDFRNLPYEARTFDIAVLDPPYRHDAGAWMSENYQNDATTKGMGHADIIENYAAGMREAFRILRYGGTLWVKTQDEVSGGKQRLSTFEVLEDALALGFMVLDQFVYVQGTDPKIQQLPQRHAKKNHSSLWVFEKPRPSNRKRQCVVRPISLPTVTVGCVAQDR